MSTATTLAPWAKIWNDYRAKMMEERGYTVDSTGAKQPKTRAFDGWIFASIMLFNVVKEIERSGRSSKARRGVSPSASNLLGNLLSGPTEIPVQNWLIMGRPMGDDSRVRYLAASTVWTVPPPKGTAAVPFHVGHVDNWFASDSEDVALALLVDKWDALLQRAAGDVASMAWAPVLSADGAKATWAAWWQLCTFLDAARAIPNESVWEAIKGGVKSSAIATGEFLQTATKEGAELAGQAAAEVAGLAGEAAGSAVSGFFQRAGMTAMVVVGVGIYLYLR